MSAAQFTATKGPRARGLAWWMALATSSLPVPLSPLSITVESVRATFEMKVSTRPMASLVPTML